MLATVGRLDLVVDFASTADFVAGTVAVEVVAELWQHERRTEREIEEAVPYPAEARSVLWDIGFAKDQHCFPAVHPDLCCYSRMLH